MYSVQVELLKMKNGAALFLAKATLLVILWRQNAWFQRLLFEVRFFKLEGASGGR